MLLDKEFLIEEYQKKHKSIKEIAIENDIAVGSVYNYLKKYEIPTRDKMNEYTKQNISKALKGKPSPRKGIPLSDDVKEKISASQRGRYKNSTQYGGHAKRRNDGYIAIYLPTHPNSTKDGYVMEHHLVMENKIGRYLKDNEVVHHINGKRGDNRIENLKLMTSKEHMSYHMKIRHKNGELKYNTTSVINVETGEKFNSIKEACLKYNILSTNISRVCRGKQKTAGGYHWKYC